jgi:transposase
MEYQDPIAALEGIASLIDSKNAEIARLTAERDALAESLRAIVGQGDRRDCTDLTLLAGCAQIARAALARLAP